MVLKNKIPLLSLFTIFGSPLLAGQIPFIYINGGPINTNLSSCVSIAKEEMRLGNFTRNLQIVYDENNSHSATIRSEHTYKPVSITYRCMTDINTWTFGIGSVDEGEAWDAYVFFYKQIKGVTKN